MKKKSLAILTLCVLSICSSGYSVNNLPEDQQMMPENQQMQNMPQQQSQGNQMMKMPPPPPRMMNRMHMMQITEQDLYSHLNDQDKAIFDKLTPEEKKFVIRAVNMAPELHMMMRRQQMRQTP